MEKIVVYQLVPVCEGMLDPKTGVATTSKVFSAKYPGGTNQVRVKVQLDHHGKKWHVITEFL